MSKNSRRFFFFALAFWSGFQLYAQDRMLCSNNPARSWWDVQHYSLNFSIDTASGFLSGNVCITASITGPVGDSLQIDLQEPMTITSVSVADAEQGKRTLTWKQYGNTYFLTGDLRSVLNNDTIRLSIAYEGIPKIAARAPWDGGMILDRDENGKRWIAMACQGIGASVWFPCKDFQGDEPDQGMLLRMAVPGNLEIVSNGKRITDDRKGSDTVFRSWQVTNPINNYDISFYIGDYVHWTDTLNGAKGTLGLDYYVLRSNLAKARKHFAVVKPMLYCFEEKMGPYPFYEDGYKLVDAPYLGMEHQSAVAYGNRYKMGYEGKDRSGSGVGLLFDFIIIHESGHEWFGNNITAYDKADTWIHEGFTTYTETLFAECLAGKEKAFRYQRGKKRVIRNDRPVEGIFDACDEGSGDHYDKAAFMIHMIRMVMDDDSRFFGLLREMNNRFYHRIVTGKEVEQFINTCSGKDFSKVFDQYLRTSRVPRLEWKKEQGKWLYRWAGCVPGFDMPVLITADRKTRWIYPGTDWKTAAALYKNIRVSEDFLADMTGTP